MKHTNSDAIFSGIALAAITAITILAAYGWVINIVKLVNGDFVQATGLLVLRVVGIFVAPLGSVLGFL